MRKIFLLIGITLVFLSCQEQLNEKSNFLQYIPQKSAVVVRTTDWSEFGRQLKTNEALQLFSETSLYQTLNSRADLLKSFSPSGEVFLSFVPLGSDDYDLALLTKNTEGLFPADSTFIYGLKKSSYNEIPIYTLTQAGSELHYIYLENVFLGSTSKILLENAIRKYESGDSKPEESFVKALETGSRNAVATLLIKGNTAKPLFRRILPGFSFREKGTAFDWLAADLETGNGKLILNGVLMPDKQENHTFSLTENLKPGKTQIPDIIPVNARGAISFAFKDWNVYKSNLARHRNILLKEFDLPLQEFMATLQEAGSIHIGDDQLIAARSLDIPLSEEALKGNRQELEIFREITLFRLNDSLAFKKSFSELLNPPSLEIYCQIDEFFIFAEKAESLKNFIADYQNGAVVGKLENYKELRKKLSDQSTLFYIGLTPKLKEYLASKVSAGGGKTLTAVDLKDYPYAALQLVQENKYMHLNAILEKNTVKPQSGLISQIAGVKLDAELASPPQLVRNYRTEGMDILVQDKNNKLYLINNAGKILWEKELKGQMLGKAEQVDLFKNGRLQLAFAAGDTFHILDSNGETVAPFPIKEEKEITQPLAVYDYDGNRNYRFVVTRGDQLQMYDSQAKKVTGFTFNQAEGTVLFAPEHIRIGTKDYILVAVEGGTLHILDRTGKTRIPVKEKINFAKDFVFRDGDNFVLYNTDGQRITILQSGKITKSPTKFGSDLRYRYKDGIKALVHSNILVIDNKNLELDYGLYTGLNIVKAGKKKYIALTDEQAKRVYIFDETGKLLPNFPVYGSSRASLGTLLGADSFGFTVQGEKNSVLIYRINP